jgi:hypothetical protein
MVSETIQQVVPMVPSDMRVELGLIGSLFASLLVYQAAAQTINQMGEGKVKKDAAFAKNFAERIIRLINDPEFQNLIRSVIILRTPEGEPISEERIEQIRAMLNFTLLYIAFAVKYKIETGHLTGKELADMIRDMLEGKIPNDMKENDPRFALIKAMKGQIDLIPHKEFKKMLQALQNYYDKNPNIDEMIRPSDVLQKVFASPKHFPQRYPTVYR